MTFERLDEKYLEQALNLALAEYKKECSKIKELPDVDFKDKLDGLLTYLFKQKHGVVAKEGVKVIGYMSFIGPLDGFFGVCKGAFCPLGGSAFLVEKREVAVSKIMAAATEQLVLEDGVTSFAISRYANDTEVANALVLNGFGIRCSDAVMKLGGSKMKERFNEGISFRELKNEEKPLILDLRKKLVVHLQKSPVYFPSHIGDFMEWFSKEGVRVFAASKDDDIIGFMAIQDEAETFVSEMNGMVNICGAFVNEEFRGQNVATDLLHYVCEICEKEGAKYLGVDCETLNPNALHFWGKHFTNYTYSYHRRIDERVIGYDSYLEKEWGELISNGK